MALETIIKQAAQWRREMVWCWCELKECFNGDRPFIDVIPVLHSFVHETIDKNSRLIGYLIYPIVFLHFF